MVDHLMKILNESDSDDNIDTDEDPQFPKCEAYLSDKNLEQDNNSSDKKSLFFMCGRKKNSSTVKCNKRVSLVCKQHSKKQILCLSWEPNSEQEILD